MIDTHLHLFQRDRFTYPWTAEFPALQADFDFDAYRAATAGCGVGGGVFLEVDVDEKQSGDEARHFCELARDPANGILGVVASGRPEHDGFEAYLDAIASPALKGIRRVLHTQPDALSQSARFRENIRRLACRDLSFDLCVLERQLPLAIELVDACPKIRFVLDHCGVPDIAAGSPDFWRAQITELARRPNVICKISGIILYADEPRRTAGGLEPWFSHVLESFGWDRVVWGGDWPVCTLAAPLADWVTVTRQLLDRRGATPDQRKALLTENAKRIYRLD